MIKTIVKRELINYLKNPIYYIGAILVFLSVYGSVSPYLQIHYFQNEGEIKTLDYDTGYQDADIMDGYIPASKEDKYLNGLMKIKADLIKHFNVPQTEAEAQINKLKESGSPIANISTYLEAKYSFYNVEQYFKFDDMKKATVEEANNYINNALSKKTYSNFFSRKYVDYLTLNIIFYAILLFAFLFIRDSKKDIYELLHTKPIKARQYIIGKLLGGLAAILLVVIIVTVIFDAMVIFHGNSVGFPVSIWDLWLGMLLYVIPNIFMVVSVYAGVSVLFKNPLPAIPALVLYMIYSNMGTRLEDGSYGYRIRKLAILVRFPDTFFETVTPAQAIFNQLFLVACAMLIIFLSINVWKRRRVY